MKKFSLRVVFMALVMMCALSFGSTAGAKTSPLTNILVIIDAGSKGTTITADAAIAESAKLPSDIIFLAPNFCKLKSFQSFDSKTATNYTTLKTSKKFDRDAVAKVAQYAYSARLTDQRGVRGIFTCDSIINNEAGQHTIFGIGWTVKDDADTLTIGAIAPKGQVGIGKGITFLGTDSAGNQIYGKTFKQVKANTEYVLQMGFEKEATKAATNQQPEKQSFFSSKNALLIISLSALLLAAIVVLIIVVIKSRGDKKLAYEDIDELDENDSNEDEFESDEADIEVEEETEDE